ncbi:hypothetical protein DBV15_00281 [Temnothorax longispinosus]|uniref:Uncharacterized protein n=1 Tax=Temnothorax longispinosus TaxID=300112 RepID=A0A4S2KVT5_9HYME|nr:hypothetical protein DBV15_00281 [Temnothorax longispinosus]
MDTCDIVVDVGGVYDHTKHRYDHRMRDFQISASTIINQELESDWMIVHLTAAGLIYCHFGRRILKNELSDVTDEDKLNEIFKIIYAKLIRDIDARDNGPQMYSSLCTLRADIYERNYLLSDDNTRDEEKDQVFELAVDFAQKIFLKVAQFVKNFYLPSMDIVRYAVKSRFKVDYNSSGEIIILSKFVPYEEYLFEVEKEMNVVRSIKFVIWKDGNNYSINCVQESCMHRMLFPKAWGGLSNGTLVEKCGIEGALHVHSNRHTGIHKTEKGAIKMAWRTLELDNLTKTIGRYIGSFYCSEVFACALLKLLPEYKNASIQQKEHRYQLFECDIIVGDLYNSRPYDPERYGHTMVTSMRKRLSPTPSTKKPKLDVDELKLNSAGVVYHDHGHEILRNILPDIEKQDTVINEIYKFIFVKAVDMVQKEFLEIVREVKNVHCSLLITVRKAIENRYDVDLSGEIILLSKCILCKQYLFYIEEDLCIRDTIKYIICKSTTDDTYWIECVSDSKTLFARALLPEAWGNLETKDLEKACGIEGALFVFSNRHRGGHKTKDGAIEMAQKALKIGQKYFASLKHVDLEV